MDTQGTTCCVPRGQTISENCGQESLPGSCDEVPIDADEDFGLGHFGLWAPKQQKATVVVLGRRSAKVESLVPRFLKQGHVVCRDGHTWGRKEFGDGGR